MIEKLIFAITALIMVGWAAALIYLPIRFLGWA